MNQGDVLRIAAGVRLDVLKVYSSYGSDAGRRIARRCIFEIGDVTKGVIGPAEAARILYSCADAVSAEMPIEDFRLLPVANIAPLAVEAAAPAVASSERRPLTDYSLGTIALAIVSGAGRALWRAITHPFFVGFVLGLLVAR